MLLSIFSVLYEVVGEIGDYAQIYEEQIFDTVGLFSLIGSIVLCLVFYVVLGRYKPVWHKTLHWFITLILLVIAGYLFAIERTEAILKTDEDGFMINFALLNAFYCAVYFFIASLFIKRLSIYAKHTPF